MRLVIHMGCHKTATTSFQKICQHIATDLANAGIIYDTRYDWLTLDSQHSELAWQVANGDVSNFKSLLQKSCRQTNAHTILISGEDFENFLIQFQNAQKLEDLAWDCGIAEIYWILVCRSPFEYFKSIYAQISGSPAILSYGDAADAALKTGYLNVGRLTRNWIFVFDVARFVPRFRDAVSGRVALIAFDEFIDGGPGHLIFEGFLGKQLASELMSKVPKSMQYSNKGKQSHQTEREYISRFLGLRWRHSSTYWDRALGRLLLRLLLVYRMRQRRRLERKYRDRFVQTFAVPVCSDRKEVIQYLRASQ